MMKIRSFDGDTIVAIATPLGEGGLGVVRVSGKQAFQITDKVFRSAKRRSLLEQKHLTAQHGWVVNNKDSSSEEIIDEVLVCVMHQPKSYTCENTVEISAHGSTAVLKAIVALLIRSGCRLAEKGEFTKRAFMNGRIDLMQAEAVLELIQAKTELGRQWAVSKLEGQLSQKIHSIKEELLNVLSHLEASIDFPEEDVDAESIEKIHERLGVVRITLEKMIEGSKTGILLKHGLKIVIAGRPNVGKSSLMNRLTKENRVIVAPLPGTTRDVVEDEINLKGYPVRILDTAGIQESADPIEKEGIHRSKFAVGGADLVLYVMDSSCVLQPIDSELLRGLGDKKRLIVVNKCDLPSKVNPNELKKMACPEDIMYISCMDGSGIEMLEEKIVSIIEGGVLSSLGDTLITSVRQKECLERSLRDILDAQAACQKRESPEIVAVDIRRALDDLGLLVGDTVAEDVLEIIFNQFCVGK